jgi:hypothetical protein
VCVRNILRKCELFQLATSGCMGRTIEINTHIYIYHISEISTTKYTYSHTTHAYPRTLDATTTRTTYYYLYLPTPTSKNLSPSISTLLLSLSLSLSSLHLHLYLYTVIHYTHTLKHKHKTNTHRSISYLLPSLLKLEKKYFGLRI